MATKQAKRMDRSFHGLKRGMTGIFEGYDSTYRVRLREAHPGGAVITSTDDVMLGRKAGRPVLIPWDQFLVPATAIVAGQIKLRPLAVV